MGIFNSYMKEGKGVDKNAPKKKGLFLYFDIVFRKFMPLIKSGFMHFICSLPFLMISFFFLSEFVIRAFSLDQGVEAVIQSGVGDMDAEELSQLLYLTLRVAITILIFNFYGSGPVTAAYAFVTRCYTRGEPVWMMSDGWDKFRENFKQSMLLLIIDIVVFILGMNAIGFYNAAFTTSTGMTANILLVARYCVCMLLGVYMAMHMYVYQIMVTYECKLRTLIKSSIMMAIAKLPMTVLLIAISGGLVMLIMNTLNPMVAILVYAIFGGMFMRYPIEFYASRVIEKNIRAVKKQERKNQRAQAQYNDEDNKDE